MSKAMYHKLICSFLIFFLIISCSKKEPELNLPSDKEKSFEIYKEAVEAMNTADYFFAAKKFLEEDRISSSHPFITSLIDVFLEYSATSIAAL